MPIPPKKGRGRERKKEEKKDEEKKKRKKREKKEKEKKRKDLCPFNRGNIIQMLTSMNTSGHSCSFIPTINTIF